MVQKQALQAYSVAIQTTPKTRQVVMLYEGIIRFLKQAKGAINENRIEDRFKYIHKASKIITALQNSLDFDGSEEVTRMSYTLHRFYTDINSRALNLNFIKNSIQSDKKCSKLIDDLQRMADVWNEIDHNLQDSDSAPAPEPATSSMHKNSDGNVTFSA